MAEVEAGKLAEQKAQDAQVKQFAQRMVHDHTQANDRLKQIAASHGVSLPAHLDKKGQKELDKLGKLSGEDFDKTYMKDQVSDHKKVIDEFEKEAKSGKNADIRNFAENTLPTLKEHLQLAQSAQESVMSAKSGNNGSRQSSKQSSSDAGMKAAKKATGATYVTAEKQEHMPVPKTGM